VIFAVAALQAGAASADMYKWADAQGQTHFDDHPPATGKSERVIPSVNTYSDTEVMKSDWAPSDGSQAAPPAQKVVMYSASWCGICRKARTYFQRNNIPFVEYDVETSDKGRADYRALHGHGVPIILVGSQRMNGFDARDFNQMYQSASGSS